MVVKLIWFCVKCDKMYIGENSAKATKYPQSIDLASILKRVLKIQIEMHNVKVPPSLIVSSLAKITSIFHLDGVYIYLKR